MKRFCSLSSEYGVNIEANGYRDDGVRLIRTSDIGENGQLKDDGNAVYVDRSVVRDLFLEPNDLLFSRSGTLGRCLRYVGPKGTCTFAAYLVRFRVRPELDSRFISYCAQARFFSDQIEADSIQSTIANFNGEKFGNIELPWHEVEKQRAIANYLDAETARIDALIEKKRQMIAFLNERFRALVASRLNTWDRKPLKRLVSYTEGPGIMATDFRDEGTPLIRVAGVGGPTVTLNGCNYLDPVTVASKWRHFALASGDFVISASASMGTVSLVDEVSVGSIPYTGLIRFRPRGSEVDMEYVRYFLGSDLFMDQIDLVKTGVAIQHFGPTHLGGMSIPAPPLSQQKSISDHLRRESHHTHEVVSHLQRQLLLMVEHRVSMVTAAVTGQLDTPGLAA